MSPGLQDDVSSLWMNGIVAVPPLTTHSTVNPFSIINTASVIVGSEEFIKNETVEAGLSAPLTTGVSLTAACVAI